MKLKTLLVLLFCTSYFMVNAQNAGKGFTMLKLHVDDAGNITIDENFNDADQGPGININEIQKGPDARLQIRNEAQEEKIPDESKFAPSHAVGTGPKGPDAIFQEGIKFDESKFAPSHVVGSGPKGPDAIFQEGIPFDESEFPPSHVVGSGPKGPDAIFQEGILFDESEFAAYQDVKADPNLTYYFGSGSTTNMTFTAATNQLDVAYSVQNNGTVPAGAFRIGFYLSTNTIISPGDILVGTGSVGSLTNGFYTNRSISVDLDNISGLSSGTYYVGVYIDDQYAVVETDESDNSDYWLSTISPVIVGLPNLTYYFGTGSTTNMTFTAATNQLDVAYSVQNDGTTAAGAFRLGFYLSTNTTITPGDILVGTGSISSLTNGHYTNRSISVDLDNVSGLSSGTYYVGIFIDDEYAVTESDENDNSDYWPASISPVIVHEPNLTLYSGTGSTNSYNFTSATHVLDINTSVQNNGNGAAGSFRIGIYLSDNTTISTGDILVGYWSEAGLASGSYLNNTASLDLSATGVSSGIYYVGFIFDYQGVVTESNEADNAYYFSTPFTYSLLPGPATVSGPSPVCPGSSETYTASASDATSYTWTVPSGWTINSGQGTSSVSVTTGSSSGSVCATPSNGEGSGTQGCLSVTVNSLPGAATVSGSSSICGGTSGTYTASASNASSYTWTVPSGWTINSGQGTSSVSVTAGSSSGSVCATPANSCGSGGQGCLSVTIDPLPGTATITGSAAVCDGASVTYTASASNTSSYTWTVPSGWTITSGQGTSSVSVTAGSSGGSVCATPSNGCGSGTQGCKSVTITTPVGAATITGEASVCEGASESYTASASNASAFTWSVPSGWTINSGQGTSSVSVTVGGSAGDVCVIPSNGCGDGTPACYAVTVSPLPDVPGTITGETNPLVDETHSYSIDPVSGADSYNWQATGGSISGDDTEVSITWTVAGAQQVTVTAENGCGESGEASLGVTVTSPGTPVNTLTSEDIRIYPNPTSEHLSIQLPSGNESGYLVSILDISGNVVYQEMYNVSNQVDEYNLDISYLSSGVYFLHINSEDSIFIEKIIKE